MIRWIVVLSLTLASPSAHTQTSPAQISAPPPIQPLPDSPGTIQQQSQQQANQPQPVIVLAEASYTANGTALPSCSVSNWRFLPKPETPAPDQAHKNCVNIFNPYTRFLDTEVILPMTPHQKGYLAFNNLADPFNLATILATSGTTIAINSHTAYGPGWSGFGRSAGISFVQDATGEFFGTWIIPSLTREDPRYHRMPTATIPHRFLHALSRTIIAQSDNGTSMPNYSTLLTYPIVAEISNFYVPGIHTNGPSTVARIATGLALDPVNNLIIEFLPDVARRVHIRVIFVQRILNQVASGQPGPE